MAAYSSQPLNSVATPETDPFNPECWQALLQRVKIQRDVLSEKSLEAIVLGLTELAQVRLERLEAGNPMPTPPNQTAAAFVRLSRSYNNPSLLKEIGAYFFRDFEMPEAAQRLFERSLRVGGSEKELGPLMAAASIGIQNSAARKGQREVHHTGVTEAKARRPVLQDAIRATGKMHRFKTKTAPPRTGQLPSIRETGQLPLATEECFEQAEKEIAAGNLRKARRLLSQVDKAPLAAVEMWQAWTNLGEACYGEQLYEEAVFAYDRACGYRPDLMTCHFNLGLAHHMNGNYNEALIAYHRADRLEPNNAKVWCNLGALYFQMDEYKRAELALNKSIGVQPDYARAWDNLAATLGAQNKIDAAFEACLKVLAYKPNSTETQYKLGAIHYSRGDWRPALESFNLAAQNPLLAAPSYCYLSLIHSTMGDLRAAENAIRRTQALDNKCEMLWLAWNSLGVGLAEANYLEQALSAYSAAQVLKPDEPEIWYNLGVASQNLRNFAQAMHNYERCVEYNPQHIGAWHNLGLLHAEQNEHVKAQEAFRTILDFAPDDMQAWYDLAISLHHLQRHEEAQAAFTRASKLARSVAEQASAA